eukprot:1065260-Prymnesium_polylepis.1
MQKSIVTEEFASEETFGQAAARPQFPGDGARIHGQIARAAGRGRDGSCGVERRTNSAQEDRAGPA